MSRPIFQPIVRPSSDPVRPNVNIMVIFGYRAWQPGERKYDIANDVFYECLEEDIRLEVISQTFTEQPVSGESPHQLGYHEEPLCDNLKWKVLADGVTIPT